MKEHDWECKEIDCVVDICDFWICRECGAWVGSDPQKPSTLRGSTPFLPSTNLSLSLCCDESKRQIVDLRRREADDAAFAEFMRSAKGTSAEIAQRLGISTKSVRRWRKGYTAPHPALRAAIREALAEKAAEE